MVASTVPFSLEVFPARSSAAALALGHTVQRLAAHSPSFIAVTSGADGTSAAESADLVEYISRNAGVPVLAHVTTWGRSDDELRDRLRELREQGVRHILAVKGDPPRVDPGTAGDLTSADLVAIARETFAEQPGDVTEIAVAAFPDGHPSGGGVDRDLELLLGKQRAGATRALTQVQFTADAYAAYLVRAREHGITIPIVPGILPVTNAGRLRRVAELTGSDAPAGLLARLEEAASPSEAEEAGVEFATDLARDLLAAGAPGLHFYTLNLADPVLRVIAELGLTPLTPRDEFVATTTHREFA